MHIYSSALMIISNCGEVHVELHSTIDDTKANCNAQAHCNEGSQCGSAMQWSSMAQSNKLLMPIVLELLLVLVLQATVLRHPVFKLCADEIMKFSMFHSHYPQVSTLYARF